MLDRDAIRWHEWKRIGCTEERSLLRRIFNCYREHRRVRHSNYNSFFNGLLDRLIMTKALPLGINWIDAPTRKNITLPDESLPVNLILILLALISACHFENLYKLSHSKSSPLSRETFIIGFGVIFPIGRCWVWWHWVLQLGFILKNLGLMIFSRWRRGLLLV